MSYLLDRKNKRKKIAFVASAIIFLGVFLYFRAPIFSFLSAISQQVFKPAIYLKNNLARSFSGWGAVFSSKRSLSAEIDALKLQLLENEARTENYNSILDENERLKEILDRASNNKNFLLSAILSKPNKSPYDTMLVDAGGDLGVKEGDLVFALGNIPVGRVAEVYSESSKVILFSTSGEKTEVLVDGRNTFIEIIGRGGGNFEMVLPRDFELSKDSTVSLPGITPYTVAAVKAIVSDPRDSFTKALLVSPVNMHDIKFVQIRQ